LYQQRGQVIRPGINQKDTIVKTAVKILPMRIFTQMEHTTTYVGVAYSSYMRNNGGD
jgi:hypothetical protein